MRRLSWFSSGAAPSTPPGKASSSRQLFSTEGEETTAWAREIADSGGSMDETAAKTVARLVRDHAREKAGRLAAEKERDHYRAISGDLLQADHAAEGRALKAEATISRLEAALLHISTLDEAVQVEALSVEDALADALATSRAALSPEPRT